MTVTYTPDDRYAILVVSEAEAFLKRLFPYARGAFAEARRACGA